MADDAERRFAFLQALRGGRGRMRGHGLARGRRERGILPRVFVRPAGAFSSSRPFLPSFLFTIIIYE